MKNTEANLEPESAEKKIQELLDTMSLREKIGQIKARFLVAWTVFFDLSRDLSDAQKERFRKIILGVIEDTELREVVQANYIRKNWREIVTKEKEGIGMLGLVLRPFPPKESADIANQIQKTAKKVQKST